MKLLTLIIYVLLTVSWLYILIFSVKEYLKGKYSSKSLFTILFSILIVDSLRTLIESTYFGTRLASQYGVLPHELFEILSNPAYLFIPKLINAVAAILIISLIIKKWYPLKELEQEKLEKKYLKEKEDKQKLELLNKDLDILVKEKTKELEELNHTLQIKIDEEVEKNKIQEQRIFSQSKMAAMGEMLRNIAHQWRQPLSTVSTLSSGTRLNLELEMIEKEDVLNRLDQITQTTNHMSQTIQDFQDFFKPNKNEVTFSCKDVISNTLKIVNPMLKSSHIELIVEKEGCINFMHGPYNEYTQVLMNIFTNARDELNSRIKMSKKIIKVISTYEKNLCVIKVLDNAGGIKDEILKKVFEPYFTTKDSEHGTGIGLYMSKEIIEKHLNGSITVENIIFSHENKEYKGAQFTIKVPVSQ